MSIIATDLVPFCAVNEPDTDGATAGGAIDLLRRMDFTQATPGDTVEVISSSASDTQNCTITARKADGTVVVETVALTGTTAKIFSGNGAVDRILQVELASAAIGTITVRKSVAGATYRTIPVGERGFMMAFRKTASDPSATQDYFVKFFWKNTNGSFALTTALVKQSADPDARITHTLAAAVNDSTTTANRRTAPAGTFDDTDKAVPGTDLAAGAAIGVWLKLSLPAADAVHRTTYTSQLAGNTA